MKKYEYIYDAHVTDVYSGDTIIADIDVGLDLTLRNQRIPLKDIRAPRLQGTRKSAGYASKRWLEDKLMFQNIVIETFEAPGCKPKQYLAVVWLNGLNINQASVDHYHSIREDSPL